MLWYSVSPTNISNSAYYQVRCLGLDWKSGNTRSSPSQITDKCTISLHKNWKVLSSKKLPSWRTWRTFFVILIKDILRRLWHNWHHAINHLLYWSSKTFDLIWCYDNGCHISEAKLRAQEIITAFDPFTFYQHICTASASGQQEQASYSATQSQT